jgi:hypothetical protein
MGDTRSNEINITAYEVIENEKQYIKGDNKYGLAISGGGIRSASFGLGFLHPDCAFDIIGATWTKTVILNI